MEKNDEQKLQDFDTLLTYIIMVRFDKLLKENRAFGMKGIGGDWRINRKLKKTY